MFNEVLVSFLYANNVQDSKVVDDMSENIGIHLYELLKGLFERSLHKIPML